MRSPSEAELGQEVLLRLGEALAEEEGSPIYRDPEQPAAAEAARMPEGLMAFARQAVARWDRRLLAAQFCTVVEATALNPSGRPAPAERGACPETPPTARFQRRPRPAAGQPTTAP